MPGKEGITNADLTGFIRTNPGSLFVPVIGPVLETLQPTGEFTIPTLKELTTKLGAFAEKLKQARIEQLIPTGSTRVNFGETPMSRAGGIPESVYATVETYIGVRKPINIIK